MNTKVAREATTHNMDSAGLYANHLALKARANSHGDDEMSVYQGAAHIRDWMDSSTVAGSSDGHMLDDHRALVCSNEVVQNIHAYNTPGSMPLSRICSQSSTEYRVSLHDPSGSSPDMTGISSPNIGDQVGLGMSPDDTFGVPMDLGNQPNMDFDISFEQMQFSGAMDENVAFTTTAGGNTTAAAPVDQGWAGSFDGQNFHSDIVDRPQAMTWDTSCAGPASSSSQSSQPDTPLSMAVNDDHWWMDDGARMPPPLTLRPNGIMMPPTMYTDGESTIRPNQGFQRISLPGPQAWQPPSPPTPAYGSPISSFFGSRRSSEGDNVSARKDKLYQVKPKEDGHYHCVFVSKDGVECDADPFRLKCNYDKHLDSHLKPYRCKCIDCEEGAFSSTACLLRHEREAHGMHGHLEITCLFKGCERSQPGRGFPRKWNAQDHMKRVHQWVIPEGSGASDASSSSGDINGADGSHPSGGGKRRSHGPNQTSHAKKVKTTTSARQAGKGLKKYNEKNSQQVRPAIKDEWHQHKVRLGSFYDQTLGGENPGAQYGQSMDVFRSLGGMTAL